MSDIVENIGEQQNSAPSTEVAAQKAEAPAEDVVTKNVEETAVVESVPASSDDTVAVTEKESVPTDDVPSEDAVEEEIKAKPVAVAKESSPVVVDNKKTPVSTSANVMLFYVCV